MNRVIALLLVVLCISHGALLLQQRADADWARRAVDAAQMATLAADRAAQAATQAATSAEDAASTLRGKLGEIDSLAWRVSLLETQ